MSQHAADFVERLQRATYAQLGLVPPDVASYRSFAAPRVIRQMVTSLGIPESDREEFEREQRQAIEDVIAACPTKYEDPMQYHIIADMAAQIKAVSEDLLNTAPSWPLIATLPTGQVNAMTIRVPGSDEHVILFESRLVTFANLVAKAVALAMPYTHDEDGGIAFSTDTEAVTARLQSDPEPARRFFDVVANYALHGDPARAQQYIPRRPHMRLAEVLRESMELFIFGHEYGHIIGGHLGDPNTPQRKLHNTSGEALEYSWNQEYVADMHGIALSTTAMNRQNFDLSLSYSGADLFFSMMDTMDKAVSLLRHGEEREQELSSHPPAAMRRTFLRSQVIPELAGEEEAKKIAAFGEAAELVVEHLWRLSRERLLAMRERGLGASPSWQ